MNTTHLPAAAARWDDVPMQEKRIDSPNDAGRHLHAHTAPTTDQIRTVGQRRRDAEEKLEHHLQEARHKSHPHEDEPEEDPK